MRLRSLPFRSNTGLQISVGALLCRRGLNGYIAADGELDVASLTECQEWRVAAGTFDRVLRADECVVTGTAEDAARLLAASDR